jgi:NAD(P)-dependent dehydrogenase (short-subunit alcohol dehydrogenase family)
MPDRSESHMPGSLTGLHALVTGAGRGIGAAIVTALAKAGADVTLLGRSSSDLESVAAGLQNVRRSCQVADVANAEAVRSAFAAARNALGPITLLVNNAGQAMSAPIGKTDDVLWQSMIAVNLTGTFHCMRECLPDMLQAGFGRIVNIASTAGLVGYPYVSAYCASKHGVIGLTRAVALEVARQPITVNAVCPGYTDTAIVRDAIAAICAKTGRSESQALAELVAHNPQGRLVTPEEVADTVLWLCLPSSHGVTGQSIVVAGGEVM